MSPTDATASLRPTRWGLAAKLFAILTLLGAIAVLGLIMLIITFAVVTAINRIPGFGGARLRNA